MAGHPSAAARSKQTRKNDDDFNAGLSFLARSGDQVPSEIADRVVRAMPEYGHIAALLPVAMDRIDAISVSELVQKDPENALGYYLQGALLHVSNREGEATWVANVDALGRPRRSVHRWTH